MKWTLNRINYYYKTLYINLHYLSTDTCISQSSIIIYYDNLALYDDRMLVIRITMYERIFVMFNFQANFVCWVRLHARHESNERGKDTVLVAVACQSCRTKKRYQNYYYIRLSETEI